MCAAPECTHCRCHVAGTGKFPIHVTEYVSNNNNKNKNKNTNTNTKYTCDTGQTRNKLLEQWVHLTNHTAGHSRPSTTHLAA